MIIGDSDQCLSLEKNCYDSSAIVLKRKLSDEVGENSNVSNRIYLNEATQETPISNNDKIHYISNLSTDQNEYAYQSKVDEIHQEGHQSYINLTVLTPPSASLQVTGQSSNHENSFSNQSHHQTLHQQRDHEIKMPTSSVPNAKFGSSMKNYQNQTGT